jgi:hypothetical protein
MSCCTRARSVKQGGTAQASRAQANEDTVAIVGTWDFKWPEGTKIRVAFQRLPESESVSDVEFEQAKQVVRTLAEKWHASPQQQHLRFGFDTDPAADFAPPAIVGGVVHPQRRSRVSGKAWRQYDVLVSLERLAIERQDTVSGKRDKVFLPESELGSYARRVDFGTPTMFLGRIGEYAGSLLEWLGSQQGAMMVIHEFGHALGLAHEHQSPVARRALGNDESSYDLEKARKILIERLGVLASDLPVGTEATNQFLAAHLSIPWPGNEQFSDWRKYPDKGAVLDSIMAVPYHDCALNGNPHGCVPGQCTTMDFKQAPTAADFAAIAAMYT